MLKKTAIFHLSKHWEKRNRKIIEKEESMVAQVLCQLAEIPVLFHINNLQSNPQLFFQPIHPARIEPPLSYPVYSPKASKIEAC